MRYKGFVAAALLLAEDVNLEERSGKDGMAWLQVLLLRKGKQAQPSPGPPPSGGVGWSLA